MGIRPRFLDAIEAVDWLRMPGPVSVIYAPETIGPGLWALASAADEAAADAVLAALGGGGLYHDHSGAVFPASLAAAPILLDIAECGPAAAFRVACALLDAPLTGSLWVGDCQEAGNAAAVADGGAVLLCCAVAGLVRARRAMLAARGPVGVDLLRAADAHWSLTVAEVTPDRRPGTLIALGRLVGDPGRDYAPCELRVAGQPVTRTGARASVVSAPADRNGGEAMVRFTFAEELQIAPGHVLAAPCHENLF
jgi:hypothetical protein